MQNNKNKLTVRNKDHYYLIIIIVLFNGSWIQSGKVNKCA